MLKRHWISLLALVGGFLLFSSSLQAQNRKARRYFERAEASFREYDYHEALDYLDKAVGID